MLGYRADIAVQVGRLAQNQLNPPALDHAKATRLLRYPAGTANYGLVYTKNKTHSAVKLKAYQ